MKDAVVDTVLKVESLGGVRNHHYFSTLQFPRCSGLLDAAISFPAVAQKIQVDAGPSEHDDSC